MKRSALILTVLLVFASILASPHAALARCGVERWSVKTGTDPDAHLADLSSSTPTTIATMRSWTPPNPIPANGRVSPPETTVWVVDAVLTQYKIEDNPTTGDSDYHLVLSDAAGNTMIAEIPSPDCVDVSSPFAARIRSARGQFDARLTATGAFQTANLSVRVMGVGMFDFPHNQHGAAPNQIELHPVLDVVFNPLTGPDFALTLAAPTVSVGSAGSTSVGVSATATGGFTSPISLAASGVPSGATTSFTPNPMVAAGGASLTISAGSASLGSYPLRVEGTAPNGTTHGVALTLRIEGATGADFALASAQPAVAVVQGGSVPVSFASTVTGGFSSAISLGTAFLPNGVTATFSPATIPAPGGGTATATFAVSPTATPGTSPVTVTGTGGGIVHRTSLLFTVTPRSPTPLIQNGGFEDGDLAGWTRGGTVPPAADTTQMHGGARAARLGTVVGAEGSEDSSLGQLVALPVGDRGTLAFWVFLGTSDSIGFDWQEAQIRNPAGATLATVFKQASDARTWTEVTVDVTAYLGQTVEVYFNVHQDGAGDPTFMYVDDVALTVTPGPSAGTLVRVFADDVESGNQRWTTEASAGGTRWAIETTVDSHSGTHRWRSNPGGRYGNNADTALISPVLDLSGASRATLTFLRKFEIEQGFDFLNVEGSADGGTTWDVLARDTGRSAGWAPTTVDLSRYAGNTNFKVRFRLVSDGSVTGWGAAVDDVLVTKVIP